MKRLSENTLEGTATRPLLRCDDTEDRTGIASRILVERPLTISHEVGFKPTLHPSDAGAYRLQRPSAERRFHPLKLPPPRQPGFPDAPGT